MQSAQLFAPELCLLLGALLSFCCAAIGVRSQTASRISLLCAIGAVIVSALSLPVVGEPFFAGIYKVDAFSQVFKLGIAVALALSVALAERHDSALPRARTEIHFFFYMSALGMMMLVSATELLTLYVALELSAYGLYILASLHRREREGAEAAAKYILFGAAASAIALYGISLIYGASHTTYISEIASSGGSPLLIAGLVLTLAGVLYKLAAFPLHAWAADTYQGAPHQATVFLATASKVAAVGLLLRVLSMAGPGGSSQIRTILIIVAVLSMSIGNLSALRQTDFKRLLGFSAVAHAGYLLLGLLCFSTLGAAAAIFYVLTYVPIVVCAFLVVSAVSQDGENPSISSLAGLYKRSPLLGLVLLVAMFGLAGIPPTPGLAGKWFLFSAVVESGHLWLVLVAAVNATISLYYYLLVVKSAYLSPPEGHCQISLSPTFTVTAFLSILLVVFLGFYPAPVWNLASSAAKILF